MMLVIIFMRIEIMLAIWVFITIISNAYCDSARYSDYFFIISIKKRVMPQNVYFFRLNLNEHFS